MPRVILKKDFFERKALIVAKELIGKYLVTKNGGRIFADMITETEAYIGPHDLASHSAKGRTKRTEIMFGEAGRFYIYFIYGVHEMLNIVTDKKDYPAAVLIRGTEKFSGPGRVTKNFGINRKINGLRASKETGLWFEDRGQKIAPSKITKSARIGVEYAGPIWAKKEYRFLLKKK